MNVYKISLFFENKQSDESLPLSDIILTRYKSKQMTDIKISSKEAYQSCGEVFKNIFTEPYLLVGKNVKGTQYFIFHSDSSKSSDCMNADVVFFTENKDLTKTIDMLIKHIKATLGKSKTKVSFRNKEVVVYKGKNKDICNADTCVTATFENRRISPYDNVENGILIFLLVIGIVLSVIFGFCFNAGFGYALSSTITILLTLISNLIREHVVKSAVRITDFSNVFGNDNVPGVSTTFNAPEC